jgi:hypothetical protein
MEFADDLAMQIPWDLRGDQVITARPAPAGTNEADDEAR